ncbi:MAG TPA: PDZ domain-containing protein, partial [Pyrinomonadaceae bacterium]|nr:PDZ domain-containing protein [Pyrinomonadaceae bacterium]
KAEGAAAKAGMQTGDTITEIGGANVLTFGDLQYRYGKTDRNAHRIELAIDRAGERKSLSVELPAEWWVTDTSYRFWSVEPMLYFTTRPLTAEQKRRLRLPIGGFASEVVETVPPAHPNSVDDSRILEQIQLLKPGDIITGVEGVNESRLTQNVERYIKLTKKAGDSITLDLLRDGKPTQIKQNSYRLFYRKKNPSRNR